MKKILMSLAMIVAVGAIVFASTGAFFSDTEKSSGNTFTAGAIDLQVDSDAHYAGLICKDLGDGEIGYRWVLEDDQVKTSRLDLLGQPCAGSWEMTDLGVTNKFFNYGDLKPGDEGENTISLHVNSNDAYVCTYIDNMFSDDNGLTEPESAVDSTGGFNEGELDDEVYFFAWSDTNGNNVWESGEPKLFSNTSGPASDVLDGKIYPLFTPGTGGTLLGGQTTYVGLYWCYGDITVDETNNTLSCDGSFATNLTQTDSLSADISFYVEQARNNENFVCPVLGDEPVRYIANLENKDSNWNIIVDDTYGQLSYTSLEGSNKLVGQVEAYNLTPNRKYQISLTGPGGCSITDDLLATAGVNNFESGYWNNNVNLESNCGAPGEGTYNMGVTDGTVNYFTVETDANGDFVYNFEVNALDPGTYSGVKVIVKLLMNPWASPWVDNSDTAHSNIMETAAIDFIIN